MNRTNALRNAALVSGLVAVWASPAVADDDRRFYASADVGIGTLGSQTLEYDDGNNLTSVNTDFDASFTGGGLFGYRVNNRWSIEGGITYRRNEFEDVDVPGLGSFSEGDFASLSYAVSALYHFNIGESGKFSGYAGPGLVYVQEIDIDFETDSGDELEFDTDDAGWQFKLGGRYDLSDRWFADASATYMAADGIKMRGTADNSQTISSDYNHWKFAVGVGWRF